MPRRLKLITALVSIAVLLMAIVAALVIRDRLTMSKVRRSAEGILLLHYALELRMNDYGGNYIFPDYALDSIDSRKKYGLPTDIPQELIDKFGKTDLSDRDIYAANVSVQTQSVLLQRLRQWGIFNNTSYLHYARMIYRGEVKGIDKLVGAAPPSGAVPVLPLDPFGNAKEGKRFRFGFSNIVKGVRGYEYMYGRLWIITGNGPDGDADIDVARFQAKGAKDPVIVNPITSEARNIDEFAYDPSNGTVSEGDIFLVDDTVDFGYLHEDFPKRYGL